MTIVPSSYNYSNTQAQVLSVVDRPLPPSPRSTLCQFCAAINKLDIKVKEADEDDGGGAGGVKFMVYAGAMFGRLLLVGGGAPYSS